MIEREIVIEAPVVDMHTHMRGFNQAHKGSPDHETRAALAGGITVAMAMPNTDPPIFDYDGVLAAEELYNRQARIPVGQYLGVDLHERNDPAIAEMSEADYHDVLVARYTEALPWVFGVKLYCNHTQGQDEQPEQEAFEPHLKAIHQVDPDKLIIVHATDTQVRDYIDLIARKYDHRVHIAHVSSAEELSYIQDAKSDVAIRHLVTCEVAPHHHFLDESMVKRLGWFARMMPSLKTPDDVHYLRKYVADIDAFATDHAPHHLDEKRAANNANPHGIVGDKKLPTCFGVTGLEVMLPLYVRAIMEGWLTEDQLVSRVSTNPLAILGIRPHDHRGFLTRVAFRTHAFRPENVVNGSKHSIYAMIDREEMWMGGTVVAVKQGDIIRRSYDSLPISPSARRSLAGATRRGFLVPTGTKRG